MNTIHAYKKRALLTSRAVLTFFGLNRRKSSKEFPWSHNYTVSLRNLKPL